MVRDPITADTSLSAFFDGAVREAASARGFDPEASSTRYLVALLTDYGKPGTLRKDTLSRPLLVLYREALEAPRAERFDKLRTLGDDALYLSGFFCAHLERRGTPPELVRRVGASAYDAASAMLVARGTADGLDLFDELASNFESLSSLLADVADTLHALRAQGPSSVLELYERWERTGSQTLAAALVRLGLVPVRAGRDVH